MVAVVQLVEHQIVILVVAGSSPVSHPEVDTPHMFLCGVFHCLRLRFSLPTSTEFELVNDFSF